VVVFSNKLESEFSFVEKIQQKAAREGKTWLRLATVGVASLVIAAVTVYALLYVLTFFDRSHL
jgi:anti-sigma-K factor RskA